MNERVVTLFYLPSWMANFVNFFTVSVSATDVKFARKTNRVKEDIGVAAVQDLWYTIVQTDQIPQRVGIDMCHAPNSPCPGNFLEHTLL
jgi:hypothetical protein